MRSLKKSLRKAQATFEYFILFSAITILTLLPLMSGRYSSFYNKTIRSIELVFKGATGNMLK